MILTAGQAEILRVACFRTQLACHRPSWSRKILRSQEKLFSTLELSEEELPLFAAAVLLAPSMNLK